MNEPTDVSNIPGSYTLSVRSHQLVLLPDRAIYWPDRRTLIIADVHLGKGTAFRELGLPVPTGGSERDLARISALLAITAAGRLIILGDLIHAKASHQPRLHALFIDWRTRHSTLDILLVRGNHDRHAGMLPDSWRVTEVEEPFDDDGLILSHAPRAASGPTSAPVLAGHVHPVYAMRDFDRSVVRVPCFHLDTLAGCLTLPAFGNFTGGHCVSPALGHRFYLAIGKSGVRSLKL